MRFPALLGLSAAVALVAVTARAPTKPLHPQDFRPLLLRPALARTVSKPWLPMLVDLLWLRSLNAIGLRDSEQKNAALHEYGVVITELDPRFRVAYEYIGLNIPFAIERNKFSGGELAADMFERGLKQFPNDVRFHMYLGFSLFHHSRRFKEASEVFARAARLPDALPWMGPLAVRLKSHSGAAEDAVLLTQELLESETDDALRAQLEERLADLAVEVVLQRVDRAVQAFVAAEHRQPTDLNELVRLGYYTDALVDPIGGFISLDPDGKANSTSLKRRMEIYE